MGVYVKQQSKNNNDHVDQGPPGTAVVSCATWRAVPLEFDAKQLLRKQPNVVALAQSSDPAEEVKKLTDTEKTKVMEDIWKILKTDPRSEHRIALRHILRDITRSTRHLPKAYVLKDVVYQQDSNHATLYNGSAAMVFYGLLEHKVPVALKQFYTTEENLDEMIHSDAVLWSTLSHPNILPIIGTAELRHIRSTVDRVLVMPWIENRSIIVQLQYFENTLHAKPPLSQWLTEVVSGLEYLHQEGIVHGSLRLSNIMIDDENHVKLMDYGTEKYIERDESVYERAVRREPRLWYPPEQYLSHHEHEFEPTTASDIYGFGCIWLALHSRRAPWADHRNASKAQREGVVLSMPKKGLKPGHALEEIQSQEVVGLVQKCLSLDPSERPGTSELYRIAKFDTLWIRELYPYPRGAQPEPQPKRIPFKAPSLLQLSLLRIRSSLSGFRDAVYSFIGTTPPERSP
ncbi:kinase-like protein [Panus rudis PR-1116 ss-1]|nr:kinase-like protein [Panus rudis PR-1116 ss-1]